MSEDSNSDLTDNFEVIDPIQPIGSNSDWSTSSDSASISSDTDSFASFSDLGEDNSSMSSIKAVSTDRAATVVLPTYSGLPVGESYQDAGGHAVREMLTARAWVKRIDQAASAVGWNNKITAGQAVMAIPTGTPAFNWLEEQSGSNDPVTDWKVLKDEIIKEFAPPISNAERVNLVRSMVQKPGEKVHHYKYRIAQRFKEYAECAGEEWISDADDLFAGWTADRMKDAPVFLEAAMRHVLKSQFMTGLTDDNITEITSKKCKTMKDMLEVIKTKEESRFTTTQVHKSRNPVGLSNKVASVSNTTATEPSAQEDLLKRMVAECAAIMRQENKGTNNSGGRGNSGGKRKDKDLSGVTCFYCIKKGHYARDMCTAREEDRKKGIWRPTAFCPPMSVQDYKALSVEEKNKGKYLPQGAPAPPAGMMLPSMTSRVNATRGYATRQGIPPPFTQRDTSAYQSSFPPMQAQETDFVQYFGEQGN